MHSCLRVAPPRLTGLSSHELSNTGNKICHFSFKLFLSSNRVTVTFKNVTQKNLDGQAVVVWMRNVSYSLGHSKTAGSQAEEAQPCRRKYATGASFESLRPLPTSSLLTGSCAGGSRRELSAPVPVPACCCCASQP